MTERRPTQPGVGARQPEKQRLELPLAGARPAGSERADAARNRQRVLAAAERLFSQRDPATVTMGDIATAAGVGRATVYRRFPTAAAVAVALLDEHERVLQEGIIHGPPPLGPGAPPAERLAAFYSAMVDLLDTHLPLALGAETGASRFGTGAYGFWRAYVRQLLRAAGTDDADAEVDLLLAPLAPEVFRHQREQGVTVDRIAEALRRQAHALLGAASPGRS